MNKYVDKLSLTILLLMVLSIYYPYMFLENIVLIIILATSVISLLSVLFLLIDGEDFLKNNINQLQRHLLQQQLPTKSSVYFWGILLISVGYVNYGYVVLLYVLTLAKKTWLIETLR